MAEYIEREAVNALIKAECSPKVAAYLIDAVATISAADVRPMVRGKWKLGGYGKVSDATVKWYDEFLTGGFLYCSACKERSSRKTNFCPNCGADMREES